MIVLPAILDSGRTVWKFESEADDAMAPVASLWLDGFARKIPDAAEAIFLALALGPYARRRLVVPGYADRKLRGLLAEVVGVEIVAEGERKEEIEPPGEFGVTLIRDALDVYLASIAKRPANFLLDVHADLAQIGEVSTSLRTGSNVGLLRRGLIPLDGVGEIGVAQLLSRALTAGNITSFLCREELGNVGADALTRLVREADVALSLPFAATSVATLGRTLMDLGLHPVACFRGLWKRYHLFPEVIGTIYRDLEESLRDFDLTNDASLRVAAEMARMTSVAKPARPLRGDALDLAFHFARSEQREPIV